MQLWPHLSFFLHGSVLIESPWRLWVLWVVPGFALSTLETARAVFWWFFLQLQLPIHRLHWRWHSQPQSSVSWHGRLQGTCKRPWKHSWQVARHRWSHWRRVLHFFRQGSIWSLLVWPAHLLHWRLHLCPQASRCPHKLLQSVRFGFTWHGTSFGNSCPHSVMVFLTFTSQFFVQGSPHLSWHRWRQDRRREHFSLHIHGSPHDAAHLCPQRNFFEHLISHTTPFISSLHLTSCLWLHFRSFLFTFSWHVCVQVSPQICWHWWPQDSLFLHFAVHLKSLGCIWQGIICLCLHLRSTISRSWLHWVTHGSPHLFVHLCPHLNFLRQFDWHVWSEAFLSQSMVCICPHRGIFSCLVFPQLHRSPQRFKHGCPHWSFFLHTSWQIWSLTSTWHGTFWRCWQSFMVSSRVAWHLVSHGSPHGLLHLCPHGSFFLQGPVQATSAALWWHLMKTTWPHSGLVIFFFAVHCVSHGFEHTSRQTWPHFNFLVHFLLHLILSFSTQHSVCFLWPQSKVFSTLTLHFDVHFS